MVPFAVLMQQLLQVLTNCVVYEFLRREKGTAPTVDVPGESMAEIT